MSQLPDLYTYEKLRQMRGDTLQQHVENSLQARAARRETGAARAGLILRVKAAIGTRRPKPEQTQEWRKTRRIGE